MTESHDQQRQPPTPAGKESPERFQQLLKEAEGIRGVSLWQDAWRRLRKSWAAMISLYFLTTVGLLAILTPALPLQSPIDKDLKLRKFLPPSTTPIYLGQREGLRFEQGSLVKELEKYETDVARFRQNLADAETKVEKDKAQAALDNRERQHPFGQLWLKPNFLVRPLIRMRLAIFGEWCIPSICGTDALGRDVLARIFWGARISLMVGLVATFVSLVIGVSYGATAGYLGGRTDSIMMRIVDIMYSIPFIFVVIFIITILRDDQVKIEMAKFGINQIVAFFIIIGAIYWLTMARVVRGQVISLKNEQFIDAAKTIGASQWRIIFRHLIPNVMGIVIVYLTLTIPAVMLFEAFLSFLGLGVEPPDVSWGQLANEGIKVITPIKIYWWLVLFPGLVLTLTLFALNFLGDGLRDALDPRLKNR